MSDPHDSEQTLAETLSYPLFDAITNRRSRRFPLGAKYPGDFTPFESTSKPVPLTELEEALLVTAGTGVTGRALVESPFTRAQSSGDYSAATFMSFTGRSYASPCSVHSTELFFTNDTGIYMMKHRGRAASKMRELEQPTATSLVDIYREHRVLLKEGRLDIPRQVPVVSPMNQWNTNMPGTTMFFPITDLTLEYINLLMTSFDPGLKRYIYDDIAGTEPLKKYADAGHLDRNRAVPLSAWEQMIGLWTAGAEQALICQNMFLTIQAMGLGGWIFSAPDAVTTTNAMGFRMVKPTKSGPLMGPHWIDMSKHPGFPVGLPGLFEAKCPPNYPNMAAAVQAVYDDKWQDGGVYDSKSSSIAPYQGDRPTTEKMRRHEPASVDATKELCTYIWETYGRFPIMSPPMRLNICFQAHHLETAFYDKYYPEGAYPDTVRDHMAKWHAKDSK